MDLVNGTRICYLCEKPVEIVLLWPDDKFVCEHCGAERRVKDYLPAGEATYKGSPQATVRPQAPTEEELLLAMSNTELLREIVRNQRQMLVVMKSTNRRSGLGLLGFLNVFRLLSDDSE